MEDNKKESFFDYDEYVNDKNKSSNYNNSRKKNRKKKRPNNNARKPAVSAINTSKQADTSAVNQKLEEAQSQKPEQAPVIETPPKDIGVVSTAENTISDEKKDPPKEEPAENIKDTAVQTDIAAEEKTQSEKPADNKHKKKKSFSAEQQPIESLKKMIDEALDEDISEIAELASESVDDVIPKDKTGARKKFNFILGLLFTLFAVIGFCSSVVFSVNKISDFADNKKQKNEFAQFIYPIVICDPAPFDQTVKLRSDTVITAAIWDIILYEDKSKYTSEFDTIIVPALDIEQHAEKLFGNGLIFKHESIIGADIQFYYEEDINSYVVPSKPKFFTYSPVVEKITNEGNKYTLLVGYISPTPEWLSMTSETAPEPDKYVKYIVSKNGDDYTLISIQQTENAGNNNSGL